MVRSTKNNGFRNDHLPEDLSCYNGTELKLLPEVMSSDYFRSPHLGDAVQSASSNISTALQHNCFIGQSGYVLVYVEFVMVYT